MKAPLLFCAAAALAAPLASAEVLYTFDDEGGGIAPFLSGADAASCIWSAVNGGSMEMAFTSGWKPQVAKLDLRTDPALSAEYDMALANGGTLSFTIIVRTEDVLGAVEPFTTAPGWFEPMYTGNTAGVWDQQWGTANGLPGLYGPGAFSAGAVQTFEVSYPIVADTAPTRDMLAQFSTGSGWNEIFLGMNSGGGATAPAYAGGKYYIDNFKMVANEAPGELVIPEISIAKIGQGMHILSAAAGQWDRQGLRTAGDDYSWVGAGGPVEYKFTFTDFPNANNMNAAMYLAPGTGVASTSPDWSEPVCIQVAMIGNSTGGAYARVSYKDDVRDTNGVAGHEYWVADDGTGQGGMLASVNSATMEGTWTLRFESDTSLTFIAPDGTTSAGTMLESTAAKFANPLAVWFSTVPAEPANIGQDVIVGGISITGVPNSFVEDFSTGEMNPALQVSAQVPAGVFQVTRPAWWIKWSLPAPSFTLEQSGTLGGDPEFWTPAITNGTFDIPPSTRQALYMPDPEPARTFFRLFKP